MAKRQKVLGRVAQPSYMPGPTFRDLLGQLELVDPEWRKAASFLRIHPRTVRRMIDEESPIDARTAMLLHILVKHDISSKKARSYLER